jgi:hypothetical protein
MSDHFGTISIQSPQQPPKKKGSTGRKPPVSRKKQPRSKKSSNSQLTIWLIVIAAIFGGYCAVGFLAIPYYVTTILPMTFQEKTGYTMRPTTVEFNPLRFRLRSGPLQILSRAGEPILTFQSLEARIAPVPLLRMDLISNSLEIRELELQVIRLKDGSYNLAELFRRNGDNQTSEIMNFQNLPFFFSLNNIAIIDSSIQFDDLPGGRSHSIKNIQLRLPTLSNIDFQADQYIQPYFSAVINGSPFELTGKTSVDYSNSNSPPTELSCEIKELDLKTYIEYLPFQLPLAISEGNADGTIDLFFDPRQGKGERLAVNFDVKLSDLVLASDNNRLSASSSSADIHGTFKPVSNTLQLNEVIIREPELRSTGPSLLKNLNTLIKFDQQATADQAPEFKPFSLSLASLILLDGNVVLNSDPKGGKSSIWSNLQLQLKNYRHGNSPAANGNEAPGSFRITAEQVGTAALFSYKGILDDPEHILGDLNLQKISSQSLPVQLFGEMNLQLEGTAALDGKLRVQRDGQAKSISAEFLDSSLVIKNFQIKEDNKAILSAAEAIIGPINSIGQGQKTSLGAVSFKEGNTELLDGKLPAGLHNFSHTDHGITSLSYSGSVTLKSTQAEDAKDALLRFTDVSLSAENLGINDNEQNLTLSAKTTDGGSLAGTGQLGLLPFLLKINLTFTDLEAALFLNRFSGYSGFEQISGRLDGNGFVTLPQKSFEGDLEIRNGVLNKGTNTFSWTNLVLKKIDFTKAPANLVIDSAVLNEPQMHWQLDKDSPPPLTEAAYAVSHFPASSGITSTTKNSGLLKTVNGRILKLTVSDGTLRLNDSRISPEWQGEITAINGSFSDLDSGESAGLSTLSLSGLLDGSEINVAGTISFFRPKEGSSLTLSLKDYPIASFHQQLLEKTELDTSRGSFNLTLRSLWAREKINTEAKITLTDIYPASNDSETALYLALLSGKDNDFSLEFSFSSAVDKTDTTLFQQALTSYQRTLIKGSVSPLLLSSGDFNDLIDNQFIPFLPGSYILAEEGRNLLKRYAELLNEHPYLAIELTGGIDVDKDGEILLEKLNEQEQQRVDQLNEAAFATWLEKKAQLEAELIRQQEDARKSGQIVELDDIPVTVLSDFIPLEPMPMQLDEAMLYELAEERLTVVKEYFFPQLSEEYQRIIIDAPGSLPEESESLSAGVTIHLRAGNR